MLRKLLSTFCLVAFAVQIASAQTGSITGQITDNNDETIPGANVLLVETSQGAATNAEGNYTISNVEAGTYTLRVTFVGFETSEQEVTVSAGETLEVNITLQPAALGLEEVVVTGYGTQERRELTGSISTVRSTDIEDVPVQNTEAMLQGRAAGVNITSTSGNPGGGFQVQIRGNGSINAGSDPLYIVDGVQVSFSNQSDLTDTSPLNGINPQDIESIEVLKDASAAAIYGSQASNGVVLITTKRGSRGPTQISASMERGVRSNAKGIDFMGIEDWFNFNVESIANAGVAGATSMESAEQVFRSNFLPGYGYAEDVPLSELQQRGTDWVDFTFDQGVSEKYNITASGGDEKTAFYISGRYEDTEGTVLDNDFKNYSLRTNFDHEVNSRLDIRLNVGLSNQKQSGVCQDGNFINCPVSAAYFEPPITFPYLENGDYNPRTAFGIGNNLAVLEHEVDRNINTLQMLGNVRATYNIMDWLDVTGTAGLDYRGTNDKRFDSIIANASDNGSVSERERKVTNFTGSLVANLEHTFDEVHNISGLVGTEYRREYWERFRSRGTGLAPGFNVIDAAANPNAVSGQNSEFRVASYFANAKYNFDQRYYLQLTGRYDGNSRFGVDNRWGFFPSASVAWRISEEDFFNSSFWEELKLRVSYGVTGNSEIGNFDARNLYAISGSYLGTRGVAPDQIGNRLLTWEEAHEINVGVDFSMWGGRFSGSLDAYSKDNKELLLDSPIPVDNGYTSITSNVGTIRNEGLELDLTSYNIQSGDFSWRTKLNFTLQRNEVVQLNEGQDQINSGFSNTIKIGQPLGVFYMPDFAGVNPADGRPFWYDGEGNLTYTPVEADRKFQDSGNPDVIGGFGNTFDYKGVSLDIFFQYSFGATAFDQSAWYFARSANMGGSVFEYIAEDRWREPGDITYVPQAYWGNVYPGTANYRTEPGTHMTYDAGYIRLKNVRLSYSVPTSLTERLSLRNIRIFASALNLHTWTKWPGLDPEATGEDFGDSFGNTTAASYPVARQVNAGIQIDF